VQGVLQLAPLDRVASAPGGLDLREIFVSSEIDLLPGIPEHAERADPHNTNRTLRIEIPSIGSEAVP
jgi:hypothetical protein